MSAERPAKGLGMGLSALLGEAPRPAPPSRSDFDARGGVREIEIARIRPNPDQPRIQFNEEALDELAESIAERGVLQPILLRPDGDGFQIVAGERRWRAAQRARLHTIPAIVRDIDESTTAELALIENIQREDLNAIEEAEGYRQLIQRHGHTQDDVGEDRPQVAKPRRQHVEIAGTSGVRAPIATARRYQHGPRASGCGGAAIRRRLTREIVAKGLSVRQAEERARREQRPGPGYDIGRGQRAQRRQGRRSPTSTRSNGSSATCSV